MPDSKSLPTRNEGSGKHDPLASPSHSGTSEANAAEAGPPVVSASSIGDGRPPSSQRPSAPPRPGGAESLVGTVLGGRYRIEKLLGEGGMGAVYQAEHTHMRKRLAVKVLHPEMSRLPEVVARFEREAMAAAHIDHPNVAAATDFGKLDDGSFFLVLEFVEGQSLRDAMNKGRLELGRALRILRQITAALGQAHQLGIVHRDLKPENVMLVDRGGEPDFVKVLDFGIAKVPVGELAREAPGTAKGPVLTQLGMVYGTPEYMAPEQALGQNVDARADIYALGILTYEMIAGVRPFDHESKVTLLGMHVTAPVPSFAQKVPTVQVPPEVEAIITKMLAKEATQRFADSRELVDAIDSVWIPSYGAIPGAPGSTLNPRASQMGLAPHSGPISMGGGHLGSAPTQVAIPSSSLEIFPKKRGLVAMLKANPKPLLGVGLLASAVVAVFIIKGVFDRSTHDVLELDDAGNQVVVNVADAAVANPTLDAQVAAAIDLADKGDYGSAIAQLKALEDQAGDRADIHRALERAYVATQNPKEAMKEMKLLFDADPSATQDPKLVLEVRNWAINKDTQEGAFTLMETSMGSNGPDTLYNIAYELGPSYAGAAEKAKKILRRPDVKAKASPALAVTLDLRTATKCDAKKALLVQAGQVGDNNTLSVLKQYTPTRGCGFLNARDCWPCMHKDGSLATAIHDIEARTTAK